MNKDFAPLLFLSFITGCVPTTSTVSTPPPVNVVASSSNIPKAYAEFGGRWTGVWNFNPNLTTSLTVETITADGAVTGNYIFLANPPYMFTGRILDNTLTFYGSGSGLKFDFTRRADGKLDGLRSGGGGGAGMGSQTTTLTKS